MPMGMSDRDIVQKAVTHRDEATNTTYLSSHHATHASKPEEADVIRLVVSSYVNGRTILGVI